MSESNTNETDTSTTDIIETIIVARMAEIGMNKAQLLPEKSGHAEVDRVTKGCKVRIDTANLICARLQMSYDDLFETITHTNHHLYALPRLVEDDECGYCVDTHTNTYNDDTAADIYKSTVKCCLTVDLKPDPPVQSPCSQCGRMSISFDTVDGILMCRRCAGIPRCADCHNPAHLLYVVDGRMICPRCESRMKQKETATK